MITVDKRQLTRQAGLDHPAVAAAQTTHTTWPDSSGSHRRWHMGPQRRHRLPLLAPEVALEAAHSAHTKPAAAVAAAAVSSYYPVRHYPVGGCCSSPSIWY
jgi:hypothetical protein